MVAVISGSFIDPKTSIKLTFKVGRVYYISAKEVITTEVPHYFIVVAKCDDDNGYMVLSTTKLETLTTHYKHLGAKEETIASLSPGITNGLTKDSYMDCNSPILFKAKYLEEKLRVGELEVKGYLQWDEYHQLKEKIRKSRFVSLAIKSLLDDDYCPE
jgi:hypothetical protein